MEEEKLNQKSYFCNLLFIGKTGAGKSSLANYLFNKNENEHFKTGTGRPVTSWGENFQSQNFDHNGMQIRIFDTVGLEPANYEQWERELSSFLSRPLSNYINENNLPQNMDDLFNKNGDIDPVNMLHGIFYVINAASGRFEELEKKIIKNVIKKVPVQIILSNCDSAGDEKINGITDEIVKDFSDIDIHRVCSVSKKLRGGKRSVDAFGRRAVLERFLEKSWHHIGKEMALLGINRLRTILARFKTILKAELDKADISIFNINNIDLDSIMPDIPDFLDCDLDSIKDVFPELNAYSEFMDAFDIEYHGKNLFDEFLLRFEEVIDCIDKFQPNLIRQAETIEDKMENGSLIERARALYDTVKIALFLKKNIMDMVNEAFEHIENELFLIEVDIKG
ncbi:septin [Desulfobotulus alkaliphilus]|uniref:Septin n=1 Tax=Desulfobotulus alkaliphilus TaxID=622671 RepID=A0A562R6V5_9BACT|nr:GTPase [Desulfobotulus alkaliphilus]TWI64798.1 septin [Desulfobotulus alkaliphilus]